jgi:hypothetical protein
MNRHSIGVVGLGDRAEVGKYEPLETLGRRADGEANG